MGCVILYRAESLLTQFSFLYLAVSPHLNLPPERLLDGNELLFEFDAKEIQDLLLHFNPKNARIDFMSSRFGCVSDFDDYTPDDSEPPRILQPSVKFDREKAGMARREPWFGTYYWPERLDPTMLEVWSGKCSPNMPLPSSNIHLPPQNKFVPTQFGLKPLPPDDSDHPLLNCCVKLAILVGKKKVLLLELEKYISVLFTSHFEPALSQNYCFRLCTRSNGCPRP